jgi:hypothetical protein
MDLGKRSREVKSNITDNDSARMATSNGTILNQGQRSCAGFGSCFITVTLTSTAVSEIKIQPGQS